MVEGIIKCDLCSVSQQRTKNKMMVFLQPGVRPSEHVFFFFYSQTNVLVDVFVDVVGGSSD